MNYLLKFYKYDLKSTTLDSPTHLNLRIRIIVAQCYMKLCGSNNYDTFQVESTGKLNTIDDFRIRIV